VYNPCQKSFVGKKNHSNQSYGKIVIGRNRNCNWISWKKKIYVLTFLDWIFFHRFLTKFLIILSTRKSFKNHMEFTREMLKDQLQTFEKI
jgi:hypothetical protein